MMRVFDDWDAGLTMSAGELARNSGAEESLIST